jgi:hypothetical protein
LTYPIFGRAQKTRLASRNIYESAQGIKLVESLSWDLIKEGFSFGNGRVAYIFQLDSTHRFKYVEFGDVATITLDEGTWHIKKKNILVLKSKRSKYYFDVITYDNFLFYISSKQRTVFIDDFIKEQSEVLDLKVKPGEPKYTREFFIAFHLMRKYYGADLIH